MSEVCIVPQCESSESKGRFARRIFLQSPSRWFSASTAQSRNTIKFPPPLPNRAQPH
jgi:hypothetical protein